MKQRANAVAALISNWSQAESAAEAAYNAAGTAEQEQEKYLNSIQGHLNQLQASWEVLSASFMDSEGIKTLIDIVSKLLSGIAEIVDNVGIIPTIMFAAFTAMSFKNVGRAKMFALKNGGKMPTVIVFYLEINSLTFALNEIH